jgi:SAM-dependent methyltransferase
MTTPATQFQNILFEISKLYYQNAEKHCNAIQFLLEDYIKKFPPASLKTYDLLFSALQQIARCFSRGKVVVEIGPGFNFGVMLLAALGGATKVFGVDLFPHDRGPDHDFIVSMFEHVVKNPSVPITPDGIWDQETLAKEFARLIEKDAAGRYAFNKDRLEYVFPYDARQLPFENESADIIFSSASFEHFRDPEDVVKELSRVTRPGGIQCHAIDMRDHRDFDHPLDFLTVTTETWEELHRASPSYTYTNRLRPSQIVSSFNAANFNLVGVRPLISLRPDNELRSRFVEPYASMSGDDLFTLVQIFIFKKA